MKFDLEIPQSFDITISSVETVPPNLARIARQVIALYILNDDLSKLYDSISEMCGVSAARNHKSAANAGKSAPYSPKISNEVQVLLYARELLRRGWSREKFCTNADGYDCQLKDAEYFSLGAALTLAETTLNLNTSARDNLGTYLFKTEGKAISQFNFNATSVITVITMLDYYIEEVG